MVTLSSRVWFVHLFPLELVGAFVSIESLHLTEGLAAYRAGVWLFSWTKYDRAVDENVSGRRRRLCRRSKHDSRSTCVGVSMFV